MKAIHCQTKDKFKKVLESLKTKEGEWYSGDSCIENIDFWNVYKENTCLVVDNIKILTYCDLEYYKNKVELITEIEA